MGKLSEQRQRFIDEYVLDPNATQAAIKAGYSPRTARSQGQRLLTKDDIKDEIKERLEARRTEKVMATDEILEMLTAIARGEAKEEVIMGGLVTDKRPAVRDRLKALELLGRRHRLFDQNREDTIEDLKLTLRLMSDEDFQELAGN